MAGMVDAAALKEIQGAITMAQAEIAEGQHSDAIELARMIISAQQREIAEMNHLLSVTE